MTISRPCFPKKCKIVINPGSDGFCLRFIEYPNNVSHTESLVVFMVYSSKAPEICARTYRPRFSS